MFRLKLLHIILIGAFAIAAFLPGAQVFAADEDTLKLAVTGDSPNTVERVINEALRLHGFKVSVVTGDSNSNLSQVNSGLLDILAQQQNGMEKDYPNIVKVPEPFTKISYVAYVREGDTARTASWRDLSGRQVVYGYGNSFIEKSLPKNIVSVTLRNSTQEVFDALINGEANVAILSITEGQKIHTPEGVSGNTIETIDTYTYLNKDKAELVPVLDAAYKSMRADGTMRGILNREILPEETKIKLILHVSSYNLDIAYDDILHDALDSELLSINDMYCLGLNNQWDENDLVYKSLMANLIREDFLECVPDVIIASDYNAFCFVKELYYQMFDGVPVVFLGISHLSDDMLAGFEEHFTGVVDTVPADEAVLLMLDMFPETKQIFVVNDYTDTGRMWYTETALQLEGIAAELQGVEIIYNEDRTIDELVKAMGELGTDSLILVGRYAVDSTGRYFTESESQIMFSFYAKNPVFGMWSVDLGYGQLGGKYVDYAEMVRLSARMANKLLAEQSASEIPIQTDTGSYNKLMFDNNMLKRNEIEEHMLPAGAIVINRDEDDFFTTNGNGNLYLVLIFFGTLFTVLFTVILILISKRNRSKAELNQMLYGSEQLEEKENELQSLNTYMELILGTAPIGYAILVKGRVAEANAFFVEQVGMEGGNSITSYYEDSSYEIPMDGQSHTVKFKMKNGEVHRFRANLLETDYKGIAASAIWAMDVERSEEQTDLLEGAQLEMEEIIDTLPAALMIADPATRTIRYCNDAFAKLFGLESVDAARGLDIMQFCPGKQPDGKDSYEQIDDQYRILLSTGRIHSVEWQFVLTDGTRLDVQSTQGAVVYKGAQAIAAILQDIAERKRRDRMLQNLADKEKEANQLKSRFLVNMSHEIRTPMNAIIGLSELQLLKSAGEYDFYKKINVSAKSLLMIINNILDFSQLEAEKVELIEERFNLESFIKELMEEFSASVAESGISLVLKIKDGTPKRVRADKIRLTQLLTNLIDNAVKFTKQGAVKVSVYPASEWMDNDMVCRIGFDIEDSGLGMSQEQKERLFQPFERFHNNVNYAYSGTGLGAAISYQLLKLMYGEIYVQSRIGRGTTVNLTLPLAVPADTEFRIGDEVIVYGSTRSGTEKAFTFPNAKVLVCEDSPINQDVISGILNIFKIDPVIVSNGRDGINMLDNEQFDLVFMDLQMPIMDGLAATKVIRTRKKTRYADIPIIAMTGSTNAEEVEKCRNAGMNWHLAKPIDIDKLYRQLLQWLNEDLRDKAAAPGGTETGDSKNVPVGGVGMYGDMQIDTEQAIARFGGRRDRFYRAILRFANDLPDVPGDYKAPDTLRFVHTIKGVAGNLGITGLYSTAVVCEQNLKSDEPIEEIYLGFFDICMQAKKQILEQFREFDESSKAVSVEAAPGGSRADFEVIANKLAAALTEANPRECEFAAASLKGKAWENVDKAKLEAVFAMIEGYEFDDALSALKGL